MKAAAIKNKRRQERQADGDSKWHLPLEPQSCQCFLAVGPLPITSAFILQLSVHQEQVGEVEEETQPCMSLVQPSPSWLLV